MRTVTIRESAFRACKAWGIGGDDILMDALSQVFDDAEPESETDCRNALLEAIVPDIRDSLRDEGARPTGGTAGCVAWIPKDVDTSDLANAIAGALAGIAREDGGE